MNAYRRRAIKGFTLVEVVCSTVLLGILATGIFQTIAHAKQASLLMRDKSIAVAHVDRKMNELKRIGAKNLSPTGPIPRAPVPAARPTCDGERHCEEMPDLDGVIQVEIKEDTQGNRVHVMARWLDRLGQERRESAVTYLFEGLKK